MPKTEEKYVVALDIGTSKVCVLVGEVTDRGQLEIIGKGTAPMKGTRRGNIINLDQAIDAVKKAIDEAEVMAGLQIESVYVGVAGDHIRSVNSRGVISVVGKHKEISREDIERVIEASKSINIPAELEEAGMIDGCTRVGAFLRITFPLVGPGLVATAIFGFIQAWNEYIIAYVLLSSPHNQTLTVWLASFTTNHGPDWGPLMAGATITGLPVVAFFLLLQRYLVGGLTAGAVKG